MKNQDYTNKVDIVADQGMDIDAGSLWEKNMNGKMVLVDDDEYITADYDEAKFTPLNG